jgi:Trk K+ transport system NAD-binding subunit
MVIIHEENVVTIDVHSEAFLRLYLVNADGVVIVPGIDFLNLALAVMASHIKDMPIFVHL